jgi:hypothetical protein
MKHAVPEGQCRNGVEFRLTGPHIEAMDRHPIRPFAARLIAVAALSAMLIMPAAAADAIFPVASRLGLVPPPGFQTARSFMGFEDPGNNAFIRLITLPAQAFGEIERTLTSEAVSKQGMTIEKREPFPLRSGNGILNAMLVVSRQTTPTGPIQKWLLIAAVEAGTAMVTFEQPAKTPPPYTETAIRASLASLAMRDEIPANEQLAIVPFKLGDTAGLRLVRVVPGVAAQFTDGPKDTFDATDQAHLIIAAAAGSPQTADRDQFARNAMRDLPPFKDVRITSSEPMRIGGQPGYEVRANGKDQSGTDMEIVQWLRFGTGAYLRILGFAPKEKWPEAFTRFRELRDGLEPR